MMNRRDLFKGLAATLVVINIPLPIEQLVAASQSEVMSYLMKAKLEIIHKLVNPPVIINHFGVITYDGTDKELFSNLRLALDHINRLITELA
jgi:hypothetical protein